jgi:mycoredoxin
MKNLAYIVIAALLWGYLSWGDVKNFFNPPPDFSALHPEGVVLYSTDWCGYCKKMRSFLKQNNIPYVEYDIEKDAQGRSQYDQLNGNGVPLMVVQGHLIRGYSPEAVKHYLTVQGEGVTD